ncbi:MAG: dihydrofolate reductase family protein [Acidobacteriota bacterium]
MSTGSFTLTIHMVASLDGFIAKRDNSVSWFETKDTYEQGVEVSDAEAAKFLKTIDCYLMGSRTYELAVALSKDYGWAYGDTPTVVVTTRDLPVDRPNVELYSGDLNILVNEKLKPTYSNVWLVGGAVLVKEFIRLNLADEIRMSVLPIILGDGVPFFDQIGQERALHLMDVKPYKSGMVELRYQLKKEG